MLLPNYYLLDYCHYYACIEGKINIFLSCRFFDPFDIFSDFGVDSRFIWSPAPITPAGNSKKGSSALYQANGRASGISLACVSFPLKVSSTEHASTDFVLSIDLKLKFGNILL